MSAAFPHKPLNWMKILNVYAFVCDVECCYWSTVVWKKNALTLENVIYSQKKQFYYLQSLLLRILGLRAQKEQLKAFAFISVYDIALHWLALAKARMEALYDCTIKYAQHLVSLICNIDSIETFFTWTTSHLISWKVFSLWNLCLENNQPKITF